MPKQENHPSSKDKSSAIEQQLRAAVQQLRATEQQFRATNQHLDASNQQLRASEQEIRTMEKNWRESFNSLEDVMILIDRDFNVEKINDNGLRLIGKSEEKVVGSKCYEVFHGLSCPCKKCPLERSLKSKKVESLDRFEENFGRHFSIKSSPIFDEKGKIVRFVDLMRDITERKRMEEDLRKHREHLEKLVEERTAELRKEVTERKQAEESLQAANQQLRADEQQLKAANQQLQASEQQVRAANQQLRANEQQLRAANQQLQAEVNERKKAEKNLQNSYSLTRAVIEATPDIIFAKDLQGHYLLGNSALLKFYDKSSLEEMLDKDDTAFAPPHVARYLIEFDRGIMTSGQAATFEEEMPMLGEPHIYLTTKAPYRDHRGNVIGLIGIAHDITERKRTETKLLEDQEQLRSMASELSLAEDRERRRIAEGLHDSIIQPLVFLCIKLGLLKETAKEASSVDSCSEMQTTINKLISSARAFTFDLSSPVLYELGLKAAIEDWLTTNIQEKHGIATTFEDDGQSKPLDDDMRAFLFKAVRELLVNVVKHAKASSVKVSVARDEDKIKICVEDNGVGFDSRKKRPGLSESSGYGLFSIHERLDYLGGSFHIESKLGRGTKVTLVAPLKLES